MWVSSESSHWEVEGTWRWEHLITWWHKERWSVVVMYAAIHVIFMRWTKMIFQPLSAQLSASHSNQRLIRRVIRDSFWQPLLIARLNHKNLPQLTFHVINIVRVHFSDWIVAMIVIRINAVANKFHWFCLYIIWASGRWRCQAFLVRWWPQASTAISISRQINCVLQVVVVAVDNVVICA